MSANPAAAFTPAQQAGRLAMHRRRKLVNVVALTLSLSAMAFGLFWLIWILVETFRLGVGGLNLAVFTQMTPPPQADGGLANAIFGSITMAGLATLLGTPIGVMAGIYLAEYGQRSWLGRVTGLAPLQRFRAQNKNRQLRLLRLTTLEGEVVYDFSIRHAPYSTAYARTHAKLGLNGTDQLQPGHCHAHHHRVVLPGRDPGCFADGQEHHWSCKKRRQERR